jgi:hypothetical protein
MEGREGIQTLWSRAEGDGPVKDGAHFVVYSLALLVPSAFDLFRDGKDNNIPFGRDGVRLREMAGIQQPR